jgi:hypothetical protein
MSPKTLVAQDIEPILLVVFNSDGINLTSVVATAEVSYGTEGKNESINLLLIATPAEKTALTNIYNVILNKMKAAIL